MKIQFFSDWDLALDYLEPVYNYLKEVEPTWEYSFTTSCTSTAELIKQKGLPVLNTGYDIGICCDDMSACPGKKICIFHGLASKGQSFSSVRKDALINFNGYLAVPAEYYKKILLGLGVAEEKIWVTGLTSHDNLKRNILYAPTHNPQISAIPVIKSSIYEIEDVRVKLHMWTVKGASQPDRDMMAFHKEYDQTPIAESLNWSDVVIGDMGSVIMEAIALGKQAIQVINPEYEKFYLERKGLKQDEMLRLPEFALTKSAIKVKSFEELKDVLELGSRTGKASELIYKKINEEIIKKSS